jgi:hypothetical protein
MPCLISFPFARSQCTIQCYISRIEWAIFTKPNRGKKYRRPPFCQIFEQSP